MPIDNDVYNRLGEGWWEEDNPLNVLHGITPGREPQARRRAGQEHQLRLHGFREEDERNSRMSALPVALPSPRMARFTLFIL